MKPIATTERLGVLVARDLTDPDGLHQRVGIVEITLMLDEERVDYEVRPTADERPTLAAMMLRDLLGIIPETMAAKAAEEWGDPRFSIVLERLPGGGE